MGDLPETRLRRWERWAKDNKIVAAIIALATILTAVFGFWDHVPACARDMSCFAPNPPGGGWIFAGYVDEKDWNVWTDGIGNVHVLRHSPSQRTSFMIQEGDTIVPNKKLHQVIVDYKTKGTANQLTPPWKIVNVIDSRKDRTGRDYQPSNQLSVMDVSLASFPGKPIAVWLRVSPIDS